MVEAKVNPDGKRRGIYLTPEQDAACEVFRQAQGWTITRLFENALREYLTRRGVAWPETDKRIA